MNLCTRFPKNGWIGTCSMKCKTPTSKELIVIVISKRWYDSYTCYCCQSCFRKLDSVKLKKHYEILSKVQIHRHANSMLVRLL